MAHVSLLETTDCLMSCSTRLSHIASWPSKNEFCAVHMYQDSGSHIEKPRRIEHNNGHTKY